MAEPNIDTALYSALSGDSSLAAQVGSKIYYGQAPQGTAPPYVIFAPAGGGEENQTRRRTINEVWRVEAVGQTKAQAITIDSLISSVLHEGPLRGSPLSISGWDNYDTQRESRYAPPVENVGQVQYWRRGAYYRIRLACETI